MHKNACWMGICALAVLAAPALAQTATAKPGTKPSVAITFDTERAKQTQSTCACFWLYGAGFDLAQPVYKKLDIAVDFSGVHATNIQPGVDLGKVSLVAGPRYHVAKLSSRFDRAQIYGESLVGGSRGFDGVFPNATGVQAHALAFTLQVGAGLDLPLAHKLSARLPEIDYVFTNFPNGGSKTQNDLRIKAGLAFQF